MVRLLALLVLFALPVMAQDGLARMTIEIDKVRPVVGEMILATVKGEYDLSIELERLDIPQSPDFDWVQLARDEWTRERVGGIDVLVMRRRLAIYPKRAGRLAFGPLTHELTIQTGGMRSAIGVIAPAAIIEVLPYPASDAEWPLSAQAIVLTDTFSTDPAQLRDGETITRTVTMRSLGPQSQMLPPRPAMRAPWLITFAAPERRETLLTPAGPVSTVTWAWELRPKTGEPGVLPAVEFPWFDVARREMRLARLEPLPIGYQSFGDNAKMMTQLPPGAAFQLIGAGLFGAAIAFGTLAAGFRPAGAAGRAPAFRRWLQRGLLRLRIAAAARQHDLPGLRRLAVTWLGAEPDPRLGAIDRALFAPKEARPAFDARAFARQLTGVGRAG